MPIEDELEKSAVAADIKEEAERTIQDMLVKSGVAGKISLIPFRIGSAINDMLTRHYRLSPLGIGFLKFVRSEPE